MRAPVVACTGCEFRAAPDSIGKMTVEFERHVCPPAAAPTVEPEAA